MFADIALAFRRLRRVPGFTILTIGTLGLGIGATTAVYSVISFLLFSPPGLARPSEVVTVYSVPVDRLSSGPNVWMSWPDYQDLRKRQSSLSVLGASSRGEVVTTTANGSEVVAAEAVDGHYFELVGYPPVAGRFITEVDHERSAPPVLVISERFLRRLGRPGTSGVGRTVRVNNRVFEIVGVASDMASGSSFGHLQPVEIWLPLTSVQLLREDVRVAERSHRWLTVRGRLAPGRSPGDVDDEVQQIGRQLESQYPTSQSMRRNFTASPLTATHLHESMDAVVVPVSAALFLAMLLALVVACSNLASLTFARAIDREGELAVRLSLGASRRRLAGHLAAESVILALAGGLTGVAIAMVSIRLMSGSVQLFGNIPLRFTPRLDVPVLLVAIGATALATVVFGVLPAWLCVRGQSVSVMANAASRMTATRWRTRRLLIALQVLASTVILTASVPFVVQWWRTLGHDPGFGLEQVAMVRLRAPQLSSTSAAMLQQRLAGIERDSSSLTVTVATSLPVLGASGRRIISDRLLQPPYDMLALQNFTMVEVAADSNVFDVLGVQMLAGRPFSKAEYLSGAAVVVLTKQAADRLFGETPAVGRIAYVGVPGVASTVVGVTASVDGEAFARRELPVAFVPLAPNADGRELFLAARSKAGAASALANLRGLLQERAPELVVLETTTGGEVERRSQALSKGIGIILAGLGLVTAVMAMIGIFGLLAHITARRTPEFGVRLALGATSSGILRAVLSDGLRPSVAGAIIGSVLAAAALSALRLVLAVPLTLSWFALLLVPSLLGLTALAAGWVPARRASRVDPAVALKSQ